MATSSCIVYFAELHEIDALLVKILHEHLWIPTCSASAQRTILRWLTKDVVKRRRDLDDGRDFRQILTFIAAFGRDE